MARKETIKVPNKKELTDASNDLRKGRSDGAYVMAAKSVAVREGASKGSNKKR